MVLLRYSGQVPDAQRLLAGQRARISLEGNLNIYLRRLFNATKQSVRCEGQEYWDACCEERMSAGQHVF